jgi:hypothetical protein
MKRARWTKGDYRTLKAHSKAKTPVVKISKQMKRSIGALRQRALRNVADLETLTIDVRHSANFQDRPSRL